MPRSSGYLFRSSIVASLGGFLFGFDTVVISGAEQTIQALWELSDLQHGLAMSIALWGTVVGALAGGVPTDQLGRRPTLIGIGVLYFVSALWSAIAGDVYSFMAARFIGGLGVGASTVAAPLYISEIAPANLRGRLAGMFQFNIVFGILVAFLSNALIANLGDTAWRWMLGVEAAPALVYTLLCFAIPESPRWLISHRGGGEQAKQVLHKLNPNLSENQIDEAVNAIAQSAEELPPAGKRSEETATDPSDNPFESSPRLLDRCSAGSETSFCSVAMRKPILLVFLIAMFNQLSGINAVLYFAPRIFALTGLEQEAALLQSIGIGFTNLVFTFVGLWLIDRLGRKTLLIIGSIGYIVSLGLCSWAFAAESFAIVPACLFAFIASHAVGQGAVIWVFITEVFPTQHRAAGTALGCSTHWVAAALLTLFFPSLVVRFSPAGLFLFFTGMMVLQLVWVLLMVPETKGVPLEEIEQKLGVR